MSGSYQEQKYLLNREKNDWRRYLKCHPAHVWQSGGALERNGEKLSAGFKGYSARNGHGDAGSTADSPLGKSAPSEQVWEEGALRCCLSTGTQWSSTALGPDHAGQRAGQRHQWFVACNFTDLDHSLPVTFTLFVELTGAAELALPKNHDIVCFPLTLAHSAPETPT